MPTILKQAHEINSKNRTRIAHSDLVIWTAKESADAQVSFGEAYQKVSAQMLHCHRFEVKGPRWCIVCAVQ